MTRHPVQLGMLGAPDEVVRDEPKVRHDEPEHDGRERRVRPRAEKRERPTVRTRSPVEVRAQANLDRQRTRERWRERFGYEIDDHEAHRAEMARRSALVERGWSFVDGVATPPERIEGSEACPNHEQ